MMDTQSSLPTAWPSRRIRTGFLHLKGGLKEWEQRVKVNVLPAACQEEAKIEIAVFLHDRLHHERNAQEYTSLRLTNLAEIDAFLVAYILAKREWLKVKGASPIYHLKLTEEKVKCAWLGIGGMDAGVRPVYGNKKEESEENGP